VEWIQTFTIIGVLGGFMFFMVQRLEKDIDRVSKDVDNVSKDIDNVGRRLDGHASRIDQMYRMFVEMQGEIKEIYKDWSRERK